MKINVKLNNRSKVLNACSIFCKSFCSEESNYLENHFNVTVREVPEGINLSYYGLGKANCSFTVSLEDLISQSRSNFLYLALYKLLETLEGEEDYDELNFKYECGQLVEAEFIKY